MINAVRQRIVGLIPALQSQSLRSGAARNLYHASGRFTEAKSVPSLAGVQ
jgi:hypothetical protein